MAAEEGPVEDSFELPALLALVRRAPGPEVSPRDWSHLFPKLVSFVPELGLPHNMS